MGGEDGGLEEKKGEDAVAKMAARGGTSGGNATSQDRRPSPRHHSPFSSLSDPELPARIRGP